MTDRSGWDRRPGFDLAGKSALVLGAETPAGAAIARSLAQAGAAVVLVAATGDSAALGALAGELAARHTAAWDVTDAAAVEAGMRAVFAAGVTPSILVTAQDAPLLAPIGKTDNGAYRRTMAVVAGGTFYAARAFLAALPESTPNPRIICLTTVFGERGLDNISAYASAHGAVHNLVRALAQEVGARNGATVNGIATGWMTYTPGRGPDVLGQNRLMRFVPARRFGEPDEVGPLAVLLASDAAGYISGQVLHIDGGVNTHL